MARYVLFEYSPQLMNEGKLGNHTELLHMLLQLNYMCFDVSDSLVLGVSSVSWISLTPLALSIPFYFPIRPKINSQMMGEHLALPRPRHPSVNINVFYSNGSATDLASNSHANRIESALGRISCVLIGLICLRIRNRRRGMEWKLTEDDGEEWKWIKNDG